MFLRTWFDSSPASSLLLSVLYSSAILRILYAKFKKVRNLASGTSELLRITTAFLYTARGDKAWLAKVHRPDDEK
ncbi:hypothetical protein HDU98_005125, partial [Podochytrium sp. JEL0797]